MASSSSMLTSSLGSLSLVSPSPASPFSTPAMKDGEYRNWSELPSELTLSILQRLDAVDILESAQKVCKSWRSVCKDPAMWRKIVMHNIGYEGYNLEIMCRHAVDRSQGGLVEIEIFHFGSGSLLNYIADRSSGLRCLNLVMCIQITNEGLTEALVKLPLLEELEVSYCSLLRDFLRVVGQSCPKLKTFKLHHSIRWDARIERDFDALAIAETMHGLHNLQLLGNDLTDVGLNAILDNCPDLEHLDLRRCSNVNLVGDLEKRCAESIKVLKRPNDSTHDLPYSFMLDDDLGSCEDDYPYRFISDPNYYLDLGGNFDNSDYDLYDAYGDPYHMYGDLSFW